jgi:hypothetical protein
MAALEGGFAFFVEDKLNRSANKAGLNKEALEEFYRESYTKLETSHDVSRVLENFRFFVAGALYGLRKKE